MSTAKTVNGYLVKQAADGAWWIIGIGDENVAGPFATEQQATEVAEVLQDQPSAGRRKKTPRS